LQQYFIARRYAIVQYAVIVGPHQSWIDWRYCRQILYTC